MRYVYNDGGRAVSGYQGKAGDCVCRAIAIVTRRPYREIYDRLAAGSELQRASRRTKKKTRSARNGISTKRKWFRDYMDELGLCWVPCMKIGTGCKVHLRADELPSGKLVVALSKHYTAVIDGILHDNHDCSRGGTRCVYGYWQQRDALDQRAADIKAGRIMEGSALLTSMFI